MEEDAGKSMHLAGETETLVDLNRAGVPLIEIVSEPDIRTGEEAYAYLTEIKKLVEYLGICDGNMEEGSLRCDANISVMLHGAEQFGMKVEVKNMNSFRNVQRAIAYEVERQIDILEAGGEVDSETRGFDAATGTTNGQRSKETLNDYRYFPEPDLPPLVISDEWLHRVAAELPALPQQLYARFMGELGLNDYDASVLIDQKEVALYFDDLARLTPNAKAAANWVMGPVKSYLNERALTMADFPLDAAQLAGIIELIDAGKMNYSVASKQLFPHLLDHPTANATGAAESLGLLTQSRHRRAGRPGAAGAGRQPRQSGRVPRRQKVAHRHVYGRADEAHRRQSRPQAGQPAAARRAGRVRNVMLRAACQPELAKHGRRASSTIFTASRWPCSLHKLHVNVT